MGLGTLCGLAETTGALALRLQADAVVHCIPESLIAAQLPFCGLHRNMAQGELNLDTSTRPPQCSRGLDLRDIRAARAPRTRASRCAWPSQPQCGLHERRQFAGGRPSHPGRACQLRPSLSCRGPSLRSPRCGARAEKTFLTG
jgi:hypothetical protein